MLWINDITKLYNNTNGIKNFTLSCLNGEIVSLIGPNGSGKTTTIKVITGILKPDSGKVILDEEDTICASAKVNIGYMPDRLQMYEGMSVYEAMRLFTDYKYDGKYSDNIEQLLRDYELWKYRAVNISNLSMGMKKKLSIAIAFLGNPKLIVLDEPTNGLDTAGIIKLKEYILDSKKRERIIIISSHVLDFVESICDKNIFLYKGEIKLMETYNKNLEDIYKRLYLE